MPVQAPYDAEAIRRQFPYFQQKDLKNPHYLDSAATSQKPSVVIERMQQSYAYETANVHRGVYQLSERATAIYEGVRDQVARFLGGVNRREIVFTSGTTAAINLVARSWGDRNIKAGDEILLTVAEHHSNIVPWQLLAQRVGAVIKYIPLDADFRLDLQAASQLITSRTKVLAVAHTSNVLGVVHPVAKLCAMAKQVGAITVIDGAQAVPHLPVNVVELGCDFYAFSSHKVLGPSGLGVLYGREELFAGMEPFLGGGDMITSVSLEGSTWAELPYKFEAGTPAIAEVAGLGAALDFLSSIDRSAALAHDQRLGRKVLAALKGRPGVRVFTEAGDDWIGIVTFYHELIHPHDMAAIQDAHGVCIRAGNHCAQPLMKVLGVDATSRVSPYIYNVDADVEQFLSALTDAEKMFSL